jgi:lipoprotein NlpI
VFLLILSLAIGGQSLRAILDRAAEDFQAGRIEQSLAGFDRVALLSPADAPFLWQRGIAQFYAGKFLACRDMFVSHRAVNPDDVENAVWHFLCVAQAHSPEAARQQILPVGIDSRSPMREIYQMYQGRLKPGQVIQAAGNNRAAQFYAQLYVGLYLEAVGEVGAGQQHITLAADAQYARVGGYMHDVARVHLRQRQQ